VFCAGEDVLEAGPVAVARFTAAGRAAVRDPGQCAGGRRVATDVASFGEALPGVEEVFRGEGVKTSPPAPSPARRVLSGTPSVAFRGHQVSGLRNATQGVPYKRVGAGGMRSPL